MVHVKLEGNVVPSVYAVAGLWVCGAVVAVCDFHMCNRQPREFAHGMAEVSGGVFEE